jgi:hypothetical protein
MAACKRLALAEVAEYEYNRGGTRITGPTIDLLRMIATRWGNIRHGWVETERDTVQGVSSVRAFAWDLQYNTQAERTFKVRHWRDTQGGGYALRDERDIYEVLANQASRRVRACLEEVIDPDIVGKAVDACRATLKAGGGGVTLKDRAVKMVGMFSEFAVTQDMIEARLGNKLEALSENQLATLTRIYKSLRDGVGVREDYFKPATSAPQFEGSAPPPPAAPPTGTPPPATATPPAPTGEPLRMAPQEPVPAPAAPAAPAAPTEEELLKAKAAGDRSGYNPLKALRGLCKMSKIKETDLLAYWAATGATDGSHSTLEEVMMSKQEVVAATAESWPMLVEHIKKHKKVEPQS